MTQLHSWYCRFEKMWTRSKEILTSFLTDQDRPNDSSCHWIEFVDEFIAFSFWFPLSSFQDRLDFHPQQN